MRRESENIAVLELRSLLWESNRDQSLAATRWSTATDEDREERLDYSSTGSYALQPPILVVALEASEDIIPQKVYRTSGSPPLHGVPRSGIYFRKSNTPSVRNGTLAAPFSSHRRLIFSRLTSLNASIVASLQHRDLSLLLFESWESPLFLGLSRVSLGSARRQLTRPDTSSDSGASSQRRL